MIPPVPDCSVSDTPDAFKNFAPKRALPGAKSLIALLFDDGVQPGHPPRPSHSVGHRVVEHGTVGKGHQSGRCHVGR
jgi:hypothetical protein